MTVHARGLIAEQAEDAEWFGSGKQGAFAAVGKIIRFCCGCCAFCSAGKRAQRMPAVFNSLYHNLPSEA